MRSGWQQAQRRKQISTWTIATILAAALQPAAAQALTEEARLADIAQFRSEFFDRDRAYAPAARQQAEQRLASLQAG